MCESLELADQASTFTAGRSGSGLPAALGID
jgi:hypothetical protein